MSKEEKALRNLIKAWESLKGGEAYSPSMIERWLINRMKPAVDAAREVLGLEIPHE